MNLLMIICVLAILTISEGLTVTGPSGPLVVPLGGSVLLPCSVDELLPLEDLEVEWKRSDTQILIHLYKDGDIRPEDQDEDFSGRAFFFTDDIKRGNFSLLLKNVRKEDEGEYTCSVHSGQQSGETVMEIKVERLIVSGSDVSISVNVGEDVTLNCSVDSHISPEDIKEVVWRKRIEDEYITVLLYQNKEVYPDASDEIYRDRVEFFTDEIPRGNFSLRLKRVRTEDKGLYMCQVFAGTLSANTTVILGQLGLSSLHIIVLILCISACGSALLFSSLIYCRSNTGLSVERCFCWVSLGRSAVLPCLKNKNLPADVKKVEWTKSGLKDPVCVFEDGADVQQQRISDKTKFLTDDFTLGNFSLLLNNVTTEDEGEYTCKVYSRHRSMMSVTVKLVHMQDFSAMVINYSCDLVVPLGDSLLLPCIIDKPVPTEKLKVEWKKSESDSDKHTVCVYEDGDIKPELQHEDFSGRALFFTENISLGNFSLLLKTVRDEDKGEYTCKVKSGQDSVLTLNTKLVLKKILDRLLRLQMFLVVFPNIIMFFAFVFWGVTEESLYETVFPCALYVLRPLMLLLAAPYNRKLTGKITILRAWCLESYYISFTSVVYSILFKIALARSQNFTGFERIMIIGLFVIVLLLCLTYIISFLGEVSGKLNERIGNLFIAVLFTILRILPSLQFVLLFFSFGSAKGGFFIVAVLPIITSATRYEWNITCGDTLGCSPLVRRFVWIILMCFMNAVMIYFYIIVLENEKDCVGWAFTIGFLQVIWTVWCYFRSFNNWDFPRITIVYVFGSVGVVLFSAVGLMTELILKTVNGKGLVGDLRIIVFSSESLFCVSVLIIMILSPWIKKDLPCCQIPVMCKKEVHNQTAAESHEMDHLKDETQPDPV